MPEQESRPPCLYDIFSAVENKLYDDNIDTEVAQNLVDAKLEFDGLSKASFACSRETCSKLGKMTIFPDYQVLEWPICSAGKRRAAAKERQRD